MTRAVFFGLATVLLAACNAQEDLDIQPEPLGQFRLGHNIAIADETQRGPFSRAFTEDQIEAAVQSAVGKRLRRYDGDGLYHLGMVVGAVVLAQPGIPVIYAPSSVMIVDVTVFDNATQEKLNEEPERFFAGEGLENTVPFVGSGLVRDADAQLANLSDSLASQIEDWLEENAGWFAPVPGQVRVPYEIGTPAPPVTSGGSEIVPADIETN